MKKWIKSEAGFTLTELLVVIVIIGILATLTIPRFSSVTTRAKATEAKLMLRQVYNLQKAYYQENDVFAESLEAIGFEQEALKTEGGTARYMIVLEKASSTDYRATATSVVDFDKDGKINVWSINQKNELVQDVAD